MNYVCYIFKGIIYTYINAACTITGIGRILVTNQLGSKLSSRTHAYVYKFSKSKVMTDLGNSVQM